MYAESTNCRAITNFPEAPGTGDSLLEIALKQLKCVYYVLVKSYFEHVEKYHSPR